MLMVVPTVSTSVGLPQIIGSYLGSNAGPIGSFLGNAAGSVISKAFGIGKAKRGPDASDLRVENARNIDADVSAKIETGKKYGIHPLTMLGVQSPYYGQSSSSFGSSSPSFGQELAMQGVDLARSVSAGQTRMEKLQERLLTSQIEGQEIDNVARASMVARTHQPGNPPAGIGLSESISRLNANTVGADDSVRPLFKIGYDQNKNPFRIYNDDLGDNDWAMLATLPVTGMDLFHGNVTKPMGKALARFINGVSRNSPRSKYPGFYK